MVDLYKYTMDSGEGNAGPYKGMQWTVYMASSPSTEQAKQTKTSPFWQLDAIHLPQTPR